MISGRMFLSGLILTLMLSIPGWGNSSDCKLVGVRVAPPSTQADHTAAAPANGKVFTASNRFGGNGPCTANTAMMVNANWTVSDPSVQLSSTHGTHVTATCTAALKKPATITATSASDKMLTGQAELICK